jgi:putative flavoprotein involved in K+ transport
MTERIQTVVTGAGQAGLAASHELAAAGVPHVVLERGRVGQTWRRHWDSFCLVTPNWTVQLPGGRYDGPDPDGFMARDEIVAYLERYARGFAAPVREGVDVRSLDVDGNGLALDTSVGRILADRVVVATGAYQRPHRPPAAATLPPDLLQIDAARYRNPGELPHGPVLVIGAGQTGCQIAEELRASGRDTYLSCGRAPWLPRRIGDRDLAWWAVETGFIESPVESLPSPAARFAANLLATGHGGGRDLHLRTLHAQGVTLLGRFAGAEGRRARFAPDLAESVRWGDEKHGEFMKLVRKLVAERGLEPPDVREPEPLEVAPREELDLGGFGAVIFAGGFRPDYASWIRVPGAFDELGFPLHRDGASTVVPGLHFVGVHFMRKRKSALLIGVGEDAAIVARGIAAGSLSRA